MGSAFLQVVSSTSTRCAPESCPLRTSSREEKLRKCPSSGTPGFLVVKSIGHRHATREKAIETRTRTAGAPELRIALLVLGERATVVTDMARVVMLECKLVRRPDLEAGEMSRSVSFGVIALKHFMQQRSHYLSASIAAWIWRLDEELAGEEAWNEARRE